MEAAASCFDNNSRQACSNVIPLEEEEDCGGGSSLDSARFNCSSSCLVEVPLPSLPCRSRWSLLLHSSGFKRSTGGLFLFDALDPAVVFFFFLQSLHLFFLLHFELLKVHECTTSGLPPLPIFCASPAVL